MQIVEVDFKDKNFTTIEIYFFGTKSKSLKYIREQVKKIVFKKMGLPDNTEYIHVKITGDKEIIEYDYIFKAEKEFKNEI